MKQDRRSTRTGSNTKSGNTAGFGRSERGGKTGRFGRSEKQGGIKSFGKDSFSGGFGGKKFRGPRTDEKLPGSARPAAGSAFRPERCVDPSLIIGRNPVLEAIKSGRTIDRILIQKDASGSIGKIYSLARERKIPIQNVDKIVLDKLAPGRPHQGAAAFAAAHEYAPVSLMLENAAKKCEDPLLVILDGLEDPHNLGAVLRSCDGAGAHGVIIPSRRAVGLTETVAKASAGAIEYVPCARVTNLAAEVDALKGKGIWIAAVDMDGAPYDEVSLDGPLALIIGGEGSGVSRLLKEKADYIISIPMKGRINSLNASNAAAVVLYEAVRQRKKK